MRNNSINSRMNVYYGTERNGSALRLANGNETFGNFTNYTIGSGVVMTPGGGGSDPIAIFATGTIEIDGTLKANGTSTNTKCTYGGSSTFGLADQTSQMSIGNYLALFQAGILRAQTNPLSGGAGYPGGQGTAGAQAVGGSGGVGYLGPVTYTGGVGASAGVAGTLGTGGNGGGYILLCAPKIIIGPSGIVSADGAVGANGTGNSGGGGGGAGGLVVIVCEHLVVNSGGIIRANGALGGFGSSGDGPRGTAGAFSFPTNTAPQTAVGTSGAPTTGGAVGQPGSAGMVIIMCPKTEGVMG